MAKSYGFPAALDTYNQDIDTPIFVTPPATSTSTFYDAFSPTSHTYLVLPYYPCIILDSSENKMVYTRDIGILTQNQSLNPSSSVTKKAKAILGREQRLENPTATEILDHLKQKLKAMAKKLRRYKESNTRRQHNSQFSRSERSF
ncbi:unnamed protein product [Acanthoscelides obtectus]|uniref:Uncharacterized protein n=1 Tax=Acanthoscelides obtectus TaxID=200917 RepID=A0A9P0QFJ8_ACAOB|nr:unnamed protein product [Acanthoscelides obtectus]CAK1683504.1 hypothetical protein AOBTE_LOCUS34278 [Acanthoscelides obtectus]